MSTSGNNSAQLMKTIIFNALSTFTLSQDQVVIEYQGLDMQKVKAFFEDPEIGKWVEAMLIVQQVSKGKRNPDRLKVKSFTATAARSYCKSFENRHFGPLNIHGPIAAKALSALQAKIQSYFNGVFENIPEANKFAAKSSIFFLRFKNAVLTEQSEINTFLNEFVAWAQQGTDSMKKIPQPVKTFIIRRAARAITLAGTFNLTVTNVEAVRAVYSALKESTNAADVQSLQRLKTAISADILRQVETKDKKLIL